ncbi:SPX and EXS domain-containing protein 1 [Tetrabaena socialis]|uniref:SPX and EXS domain-containing protein 1 n=1 Tax=Tetrabaena socialis TaxID=47790 RepID=A0A2J8AD64_9CHLO|nr:SPX and EXS domain-containing protein 1 [Tetrabaena socialis]|eukprot:PNH10464.1 SPX and EXS domain-containing protein 1 [Tetrabaena socialis]
MDLLLSMHMALLRLFKTTFGVPRPSRPHLPQIALVLTTTCLTCAAAFVFLGASGSYAAADYAPRAMYLVALLLLVAPVELLCRPARLFFGSTLQRALLPFQEVSWADFLLADIMTSLSKSFGDLAKAAAALLAGPALHTHMLVLGSSTSILGVAAPAPRVVDPLALPVLLALCLPFAVRFVQCLVVNRTTGNRSQIFNAAKYATAFPALVLTAIEHEYHVAGLRYPLYGCWLAAVLANSLYSYYWDLEMDWDMPWLVQPGAISVLRLVRLPGLKPDPLYRRGWYVWAAMSNLALRLCWGHRLVGRLEASNAVLLGMALLEVARRYQWTYVRVETEIRKIRIKQAHEHPEKGEAEQEDP